MPFYWKKRIKREYWEKGKANRKHSGSFDSDFNSFLFLTEKNINFASAVFGCMVDYKQMKQKTFLLLVLWSRNCYL